MVETVNEKPAEELHKPVITKFKVRKVYGRPKDNIWAADSAEMWWLSSGNENVKYLLCAQMFSINMHGLNLWNIKKLKQFLMLLSK